MSTDLVNRATFVRTTLKDLNKRASDLVLENGYLLRELKTNGYHREWGYDSFDACIEAMQAAGEVDYGPRQARHFVAIVDMVDRLNLDAATVENLSVSKLREIASLPSADAQRKLLERAGTLDVAAVQAEAKAMRDKAHGRDTDPMKPFTFHTSDTQRAFLQECLTKAREVYAIEDHLSDSAVLVDHILPEWFTSLDAVPEA